MPTQFHEGKVLDAVIRRIEEQIPSSAERTSILPEKRNVTRRLSV